MKFKKLLLISAMMSALGGLYGCTEGDDTSIIVEGDVTNPGGGGGPGNPPGGASDCPDFASSRPQQDDTDVCQLPSTITENTTLTADTIWFLDGTVTVGNGNQELGASQTELANGNPLLNVTLTIEPGTQIIGRVGSFANLIITRGSMIMAEGTAEAPIIFSSADAGFDGTSEWGGLQIMGFGDHNECGAEPPCNIDAEGEAGFMGGVGRADDNSGVLSYVIVAEGGFEFAVGDEINGISLHAVGSGTTIDHIQVHNNSDDGIEFYGGNVNVKYGVFTNNLDDSIDWDEGYQGNIQYAIVKQGPNVEGNAVEADTEGTTAFLSKPTIANATFIGDGETSVLHVLKASSGGFFHNSVLTWAAGPTGKSCVNVNGTGAQANRNTAIVYNNIIADCETFGDDVLDQTTVFAVDAALTASLASGAAEAQLAAPIDWTAVNGTWPASVADPDFLDATDYVGAIDPNDPNGRWYEGWILEGTLP